MTARGLFSRSS